MMRFILFILVIQWTVPAISALEGSLLTDAQALLAIKAALRNPPQLSTWSNVSDVCNWRTVTCNLQLTRVTQLTMQNENRQPFSGTLAPHIGNLTELTFLDLSFNEISGPIPPEIGRLVKLNKMYLGRNSFTGSIPPEMGNLVQVEEFTVDHCLLDGTVPPELGNLAMVRKLDLSYNKFNTTLPKELGNLGSVSQLYLGTGTFRGEIPPELGQLPFIQKLALDNNEFTGSVPLSFVNLTDTLTELNVGSNHLSGYLPSELSKVKQFTFQDQRGTSFCSQKGVYPSVPACPPGTFGVGKRSNLGAIVGGVLGGAVAIAVLAVMLVMCVFPWAKGRGVLYERRHEGNSKTDGRVKYYPFETLRMATKNWTLVLGQGGFGPVYKGIMPSGQAVAIKRLRGTSHQGMEEFHNEIDLLSRVHHRCLVNLVGWCDDNNECLLVYEYKSRGSLDLHLRPSDPSTAPVISWAARLNIAVDIAEGLEYLHHGADPPVIHRDVKSSNVLLDALYNGSVADFGLGKLNDANATHISTNVKGTPGYIDPEYIMLQQLYPASDVYAYGVLLLEMISGMKAFDSFRGTSPSAQKLAEAAASRDQQQGGHTSAASGHAHAGSSTGSGQWSGSGPRSTSGIDISSVMASSFDSSHHPLLSQYAKAFLLDESLTPNLVDPRLEGNFKQEELSTLAKVAIACLHTSHKDRPTMREVCRMLPLRSVPWQKSHERAESEGESTGGQSGEGQRSKTNSTSNSSSMKGTSSAEQSRSIPSRKWSEWTSSISRHLAPSGPT